jgi:hypothetical protein
LIEEIHLLESGKPFLVELFELIKDRLGVFSKSFTVLLCDVVVGVG